MQQRVGKRLEAEYKRKREAVQRRKAHKAKVKGSNAWEEAVQ